MDTARFMKTFQQMSYGTILSTLCCLLLVLYFLKNTLIRGRKARLPPGPPGIPFFGNFFQIDLKNIHLKLSEWSKEYGGCMTINILGETIVVLQSAEIIDKAMLDPAFADIFSGRASCFSGDYIVPKGTIFQNLSKRCVYTRKTMLRVLKSLSGKSKEYDVLMTENQEEFLDTIKCFDGKSFDPRELAVRFCVRTTFTAWTGSRTPSEDDLLDKVSNVGKSLSYFANQGKSLILKSIPLSRWLPTKDGKRYREIMTNTRHVSDTLLEDGKTVPMSDDSILNTYLKQVGNGRNDIDFQMESLRDNITDLCGAGVETPSALIYSMLYTVAVRPDIQKKIQDEIALNIGVSRPPTINDRSQLSYTEALMLEVLRCGPPLRVAVPYAVTSDVEFEGYFLPKNTQIFVNIWEPQHDPKFWKEPERFDPARFLDDRGQILPPSHEVHKRIYAFGAGKRSCPGKVFTLARVPVLIAAILQRFHIVLDGKATESLEDTLRGPSDCIVFDVPRYKIKATER